ncbi:MAG: TIGR02253 family HAD-type hydrolase [Planctomycetes bacterium]|nr:TIGR02253 family HAD-type hydrolase [Planctomycetota bacterium]
MLKAVFFDIDDTLFSTTEFAALARRAAIEALRTHGVRMSAEELLREFQEVVAEFSSNYPNHIDKLLLRLPREATAGVNPAVLVAAAVAAYHDAKGPHLRPFPDVLPALRRLAASPLFRGIITSGLPVKQAEKLLRLGVYPLLTPAAIFISDQIGISKPNPKLFLRACADCGLEPSECAYVGDHPANDIDPANEIGMVTVLARRNTRHSNEPARTAPRHIVADFTELLTLLSGEYRVNVPPA